MRQRGDQGRTTTGWSQLVSTKITVIYDNPEDPEAFEQGYG
jgi:hypothetical protein